MSQEITASIRRKFEHLAIERSPENLSCDGMLGPRQVQHRHKRIMGEWNKLEKMVGRRVSFREIEDVLCGV